MKTDIETRRALWAYLKVNVKLRRSTGCWIWQGKVCQGRGYGISHPGGVAYASGYSQNAHRMAYELANGPIPKGLIICHACDTPLCVNPKHLWAGTNKENTQDAVRKGRMASGERSGMFGKPGTMLGRKGDRHPLYGYKHTESAKARMSAARKGSLHPMYGKTGEKAPMYGKHHSPETRAKISAARTGAVFSEEHRENLRLAWKRRKEQQSNV